MTELIGANQVPCISDTDYAAYALYMRCLADQVEDALLASQIAAAASLHRPMAVWQFSESLLPGSGSAGGSYTFLYGYNWAPTYSLNTTATLNRRGWWLIGALVHCTSNTPVSGNNRLLTLRAYPPGLSAAYYGFAAGAPYALVTLQDVTWETNTGGGEDLFVTTNIYCAADPNAGEDDKGCQLWYGSSVEFNGVETVTFSGYTWAIFLGDTPLIQA